MIKTTYGQQIEVYPNLINGLEIANVYRVFQSDIFYLQVESEKYYGVTIIDIYTRKLYALHLSKSLQAKENERAFKQLLQAIPALDLQGAIFHSDRGTQYISATQKELLKRYGMQISMCKMPQQNAYVERIQGTLKWEYFFEYPLKENNISRLAQKIKYLYNEERPHNELNKLTPSQFEQYVKRLPHSKRPTMKVFEWKEKESIFSPHPSPL